MSYHQTRWTAQKIARRLQLIEPLAYRIQQPLPPFRYWSLPGPLDLPPVDPGVDDRDWPSIEPHSHWGAPFTNYVLRTHFQVPADWPVERPAALYLPTGRTADPSYPEALVYVDGEPYAGCDRHHQEVPLPERWRDGRPHHLALHGWTGWRDEPRLGPFMLPCAVVQIDQPTRDFVATARVALGIARALPEADPAHNALLNALDAAFRALDTREPLNGHFYASVPAAHAILRAGIARAGAPLDAEIVAAGHAHIDVAWLWTLGQTRGKAARTFHTAVRLMETFPDYHFTQSQPQLYDFVRQDHPALFETIRRRVAEGRWEPIGGMWVEADCKLSGPESLARQFLLGRAFFREHFGPDADSPVLWLPDAFGYPWSLPQLIKQAGLEYFFTIKIGWSQYNHLPDNSFWWQGIDGTRVLTHFSPTPESASSCASTYNSVATPEQVRGTWDKFKQKELHDTPLLMSYGHGDGGGGPTPEMVENVRVMGAFPATPRVRSGRVDDFFHELEADAGERLPTWNGELYLEYHRGTFTTQGRVKCANRRSEFLLHDAEFVAALAAQIDPAFTYPHAELRRAWQLVCLNQFHDVLPGSSIGDVYAESMQQYAEVRALGEEVRETALAAVHRKAGGDLLLVNPTSFTRRDLAFWPQVLDADQQLEDARGRPIPVQRTAEGTWVAAGELAPYSVTPLHRVRGGGLSGERCVPAATPTLLENALLRVELNAAGDIVRIYDRLNRREVLPPGAVANQWQAFEDRPLNWDAWDIDIFYDDKRWLADPAESVRVVEAGPLRATLEVRRRILNSTYIQRISLAWDSMRLDFDTWVDWRERHILLKAAFPVDVLAPAATYEIQWGNVQQPTHRNTSWDWARFETCAQKWIDLSEGGYGVSLLNNCKYGHDVHDNVMRVSLLRGATHPDPEADLGEHRFVYSLLPHAGGWAEDTVRAAYVLNDPIIVYGAGSGAGPGRVLPGLVRTDAPSLVIETVKQAEDGNGLVVRLYESQRRRGRALLRTSFPLSRAYRTNLLEEDGQELELLEDGQGLELPFRPYEIVTLRLVG